MQAPQYRLLIPIPAPPYPKSIVLQLHYGGSDSDNLHQPDPRVNLSAEGMSWEANRGATFRIEHHIK